MRARRPADLVKEARRFASETARILRHRGGRLSSEQRRAVQQRLDVLNQALGRDQGADVAMALESLRSELERHAAVLKRASTFETVQSLGLAVLLALMIRAFLFEAFKIPTGSMIPTLRVSDHIFVNKFTYGFRLPFTHWRIVDVGSPQRGDVFVFEFPGDGPDHGKDFIKRVIGVAGDRVRMEDNVLIINGAPVPTEVLDARAACEDGTFDGCRCVRQQERLGDATYVTQHLAPASDQDTRYCRNTPDWPSNQEPSMIGGSAGNPDYPEIVVPQGHVLAMGDNRDNSSDGRYWGFVPVSHAKGRALVRWWPPGRWFARVR